MCFQLIDINPMNVLILVSFRVNKLEENHVDFDLINNLNPFKFTQLTRNQLGAFMSLAQKVLNIVKGNMAGLDYHAWLSQQTAKPLSINSNFFNYTFRSRYHGTYRSAKAFTQTKHHCIKILYHLLDINF